MNEEQQKVFDTCVNKFKEIGHAVEAEAEKKETSTAKVSVSVLKTAVLMYGPKAAIAVQAVIHDGLELLEGIDPLDNSLYIINLVPEAMLEKGDMDNFVDNTNLIIRTINDCFRSEIEELDKSIIIPVES